MSGSQADRPAGFSGSETRQAAMREELRALVRTWNPALTSDLGDGTSLIASGLIDSLALFNLILWIETKSGRTIDAASIDVVGEWDSIAAIVRYLDRSPLEEHRDTPDTAKPVRRQSRYRVVNYEPRFKRAVAEFQTGLWSPDPDRNLRYLEWKYEANPFRGGHIYLAFDGDEIVGMRGFYPSHWEVGRPTRRVPLLVADDLLVSEQHRNKGLVNELMRTASDHLRASGERYVINISGGTVTVVESLAMGWRSAGMPGPIARKRSRLAVYPELRRWVRRHMSALPRRSGQVQLDEPNSFSRLDRGRTRHETDFGLSVEVDDRPRIPAMVDLIDRVGHDGRWRHVRDASYLQWRYRNPLREYRFLYAGGDRALNGFLVLKRSIDRDPPSQEVSIVDLEAVDNDVESALLTVAAQGGAFEEMSVWTGTLSHHAQNEIGRLGFRPEKAKLTASGTPYILVWAFHALKSEAGRHLDGAELLEITNWDMRTIYTMVG